MNKEEIVKAVSSETNFTKKDVGEIADKIFEEIVNALDRGEVVRIADFGKFEIRDRIARTGVNPITKEPMPIAGLKAIAFHATESVKNQINKDRKI